MKRPKSHHFVTESYLRGFASGSGKKTHLYVYERGKAVPYKQNPKKVAKRSNYYSVQNPDGTFNDSLEHFLGAIESEVIPTLRRLSSQDFQLGWEDRLNIAIFVALQEFRVPRTRENVEEGYGKLINHTLSFSADAPGYFEQLLEELERQGQDIKGVTASSMRD